MAVLATPSLAKRYRLEAGLTQGMLAGLARSSIDTVRKVERGTILHVQLGTLLRLAGVLEVGAADLLPVLAAVKGRSTRSASGANSEESQHSSAAHGPEERKSQAGLAVDRRVG